MTIKAPPPPRSHTGADAAAATGIAAAVTIWQTLSSLKRRWFRWLFASYQAIWSSSRAFTKEALGAMASPPHSGGGVSRAATSLVYPTPAALSSNPEALTGRLHDRRLVAGRGLPHRARDPGQPRLREHRDPAGGVDASHRALEPQRRLSRRREVGEQGIVAKAGHLRRPEVVGDLDLAAAQEHEALGGVRDDAKVELVHRRTQLVAGPPPVDVPRQKEALGIALAQLERAGARGDSAGKEGRGVLRPERAWRDETELRGGKLSLEVRIRAIEDQPHQVGTGPIRGNQARKQHPPLGSVLPPPNVGEHGARVVARSVLEAHVVSQVKPPDRPVGRGLTGAHEAREAAHLTV